MSGGDGSADDDGKISIFNVKLIKSRMSLSSRYLINDDEKKYVYENA